MKTTILDLSLVSKIEIQKSPLDNKNDVNDASNPKTEFETTFSTALMMRAVVSKHRNLFL